MYIIVKCKWGATGGRRLFMGVCAPTPLATPLVPEACFWRHCNFNQWQTCSLVESILTSKACSLSWTPKYAPVQVPFELWKNIGRKILIVPGIPTEQNCDSVDQMRGARYGKHKIDKTSEFGGKMTEWCLTAANLILAVWTVRFAVASESWRYAVGGRTVEVQLRTLERTLQGAKNHSACHYFGFDCISYG